MSAGERRPGGAPAAGRPAARPGRRRRGRRRRGPGHRHGRAARTPTLKIYLTAAPEARADRRAGQLGVTDPARIPAIAADLRRRDEYDSSRADSPLRPAADAVVVDSTGLDREAVVERALLELARTAVGEPA